MPIATKTIMSKLSKAVAEGKNAGNYLKDLRWKTIQSKENTIFSRVLLAVLSQILKEEREVVTSEEFYLIKDCVENFSSVDSVMIPVVVDNGLDYLATKRPLMNFSSLNSNIMEKLKDKEFVTAYALNIKSISAQPISKLTGDIIVTYTSNNDCRDRDQTQLEDLLENFTGFHPHFLSYTTEGVRLKAKVEFLPSKDTFKKCGTGKIEAYLEAIEAYNSLGVEFDTKEISKSIIGDLDYTSLNRIDSYSLINTLKTFGLLPKEASILEIVSPWPNDTLALKFSGIAEILNDAKFIAGIEKYLVGFEAVPDKDVLHIFPNGTSLLNQVMENKISEVGLDNFLDFL